MCITTVYMNNAQRIGQAEMGFFSILHVPGTQL